MTAILVNPWILALELPGTTTGSGIAYGVGTYAPGANRALYRPFWLPSTQRISAVSFWCTTTASANYDIGIYSTDGITRLDSKGSTALAASQINTWTLTTPMLIPANIPYVLGFVCSSASASFVAEGAVAAPQMRTMGWMAESSALPLPATATPVANTADYLPIFALTFV